MPQTEHSDAAAVLDDFTNRVANLPAEISFMQEEIAEKDRLLQECINVISRHDTSIQKWIRINGSHVSNPKEESYSRVILENYDKAQIIQEEKCTLAQKTQQVIDKHTRYLDGHIKALQDRGEFPTDPDIPSLLRLNLHDRTNAPRVESNTVPMPLNQINNSASVAHTRLVNQHAGAPRIMPTQTQAQQLASSAPATPAATLLLGRQARESSLGAGNRRQKLTGGLGTLPANSSGLARHASIGPGTPKAGTPSSTRAGSVGPKASLKVSATSKKVAPHRQNGASWKGKPGKSSLSRVKRTGTKNSPSSTNDSDLSEAESGSGEEDDETITSPLANKDVEGDEEMADIEDDEGGDDKKYCMCQSVSYGDMVACDNESCPYEWFHWTCVGLKNEPVGVWICPVCTAKMKK
jgi:inhibitor of growth protein 3